ncbi:Ribosome-recycling factor [Alteracholeplasma palmae J233]|uniref:Ribosome-recycling factor n=1 Tax=Alteracholeplasma palmae (strain ATCC 49389 / J233) TaxID=1318466 RepID=U4KK24_ALTPJ|nr:ribosome recycling factor [Alteracholeplasma palmae]CCV63853.1 Ribosome-recycling factor [Alteracholeplasma palmae J233]
MTEQADLLLIEIEEKMTKSEESAIHEFANIRTGRANPAVLDRIFVNYYGTDTPLRQVSSVSLSDSNQLYIKPFDSSLLSSIEQAILASQLGVTPQNDGAGIRLTFPQPTEERRRALIKDVDKLAENAKVAIRNVRRDGNDQIKKLELTVDDEKGYLEDVQKLTDKYVKRIDELAKEKSDELLKI